MVRVARPHPTRRHDRSTDLWLLALPSFGESWHNGHHSDPACARHGREPGQIDLSAELIRLFERLGLATGLHWPGTGRESRKRPHRDGDGTQRRDRPRVVAGLLDAGISIPTPLPGLAGDIR